MSKKGYADGLMEMTIEGTSLDLEAGQIWKAGKQYVHSLTIGKTLIHYRLLRHAKQKAAATMVVNREELSDFLKRWNGFLVK